MGIRFRKCTIGALALGMGAACVVTTVTAGPASAAPVTITLLNINDFHGRISADTTKFATTIEQQRAAAGEANTLLLSAGDNVGTSLFASSIAEDQPTIDVLNALDLNASAVGNHEFDRGFADLRDRIIGGPTPANFPYLGANVYQKGTTTPVLDEYEIFTVAGVRVGVIGAVTETTPELVSSAGITTIDFGDPVVAVNRVAAQLSDGNAGNGEADVIVAEYHAGASLSSPPSTFEDEMAKGGIFAKMVNQTSGEVDVIFNGHSHQEYVFMAPGPGGVRPVMQNGLYGENVGKVTLTVESTTGDVTSAVPENVQTVAAEDLAFPRVSEVKNIVDAALAAANAIGFTQVSSVTADITTAFSGGAYNGPNGTYAGGTRNDQANESTLINLVADSYLGALSDPERGGAQIGVMNPFGVRAELRFGPTGIVTYSEANAVLPFADNLWTTSLTGAQFKTLLEQQWQRTPGGAVPARPYIQLGLSDNVTYTYDPTLPEGSRITSISLAGYPMDPNALYRVAAPSFLATGGDNFHVFNQGTNTKDSGLIDRDAWIEYLSDNAPVSPDFARQSVAATGLPTTAVAGSSLTLSLAALDMTSLGSPQNTSVEVYIGGVSLGVVPVAGGATSISVPVTNAVPSGLQPLQIVASPSNTTVALAVSVTSTAPAIPFKPPVFTQDTPVDIEPQRLVDTREGIGFAKAKLTAATEYKLVVAGKYGIPAGAKAVAISVTAVNAFAAGFVNAYPCGGTASPLSSTLNQVPDRIVANLALVDIGVDGAICFVTNNETDLVVDLQTYYRANSDLETLAPVRLVDTRSAVGLPGKLAPLTPVELQVTGKNGVPADASAVVLNLTTTDTTAGYLTAYPCGTTPPLASNLNAWAGHDIANLAIVGVGAGGKVCLVALTETQLVIDMQGYFTAGADYNAITPVRAFDTRTIGTPLETFVPVEIKIAGLYGVPSQADQVAINVTAVDATGDAFITVYPCGPAPTVSSGNTSPDRIVATLAIVDLSDSGSICVLSNLKTDLVVDIQGWQG